MDLIGKGLNLPGDDVNLAVDEGGPAIAIHLSQQANSNEQWTIQIRARTEQGDSVIGTVVTRPPTRGDPPNRCVAQAFCPGAIGWTVEVKGPDKATASIQMTADHDCGCVGGVFQGVIAVNGTSIVQTDFVDVFASPQGVLMTGPGSLLSFYGFCDPAVAVATIVGLVDKDPAVPVAPGDAWVPGTVVQVPAFGGSFSLSFPRGLRFSIGAQFVCNLVVGPVVGAIAGAATVHAERG